MNEVAANEVLTRLIAAGTITELDAQNALLTAIEETEDRLGTLKMWRDGTLVPNGFGEVTPAMEAEMNLTHEIRAAKALHARAAERVRVMFDGVTPPKNALITFNHAVTKANRRADKAGRTVTTALIASRKLQGQYISLIRQWPESRRGQFSKIAKEMGREAAIEAMKRAQS